MTRLTRWACAVVIAATLSFPAAAQRGAVALRVGSNVSGALTAADPLANDKGRFRVYTLDAQRGQRLSITMRSADFDAFLSLGRTVQGITDFIKTDDDGGGDSNARLRFTVPASGTYLVVAQALESDKTGAFTLNVDTLRTPVITPPRALSLGQTVRATLAETDPSLASDESHYDLYAFSAREGQRIQVIMESSEFDAFLAIGQLHGDSLDVMASDDDGMGGETTNARLRITIPHSGRYIIRANSVGPDQLGAYSIRIEERPAPPPPPAPRAIAAGQTLNGALEDGDPQSDDDSFYDAYVYRGRAGEKLTITMRAEAFDTYLAFGRMAGGEFTPLETADDGADNTNSKLEITLDADGEYVIRANSLGAEQTGAYTLKVESARGR